MTGLYLEPERIAEAGGLVSRLLERDPRALGLFPPEAFNSPAAARAEVRPLRSSLDLGTFHCPSSEASVRLERVLAGGGLVVTTGQQPQLFGGPLYVLYKALSAVRAAVDLERQLGVPCLAVFWVAGDDHDWGEVASVGYLDREETVRRIEISASPGQAGSPVGPAPLSSEILEKTEEFVGALEAHEAGDAWLDLLRKQYVPGRSFTDAFIGTVSHWMGELPIAFLDSAHPEVRRASSPFVQRVIEERKIVDEALGRGTDAVTDIGYRAQLTYLGGAIPVFREGRGGRYRLRGTSGAVQVDRESSRQVSDVTDEAASEPERFSPSAALRPVLESWLLPVGATVLGPGEIAYWAQLDPVFETLDVPMPGILPRDSWRVVEPRVARLLEKTGVTADELRDGGHEAAAGLVERSRPLPVEESLRRLEVEVDGRFAALDETVGSDLPGLRPAVGKSRSQVLSTLESLRKTLDRMTRDREQASLGQLRRAAANLYPNGKSQERSLATYVYLARYGDRFLDAARAAALLPPLDEAPPPGDGVAGTTAGE